MFQQEAGSEIGRYFIGPLFSPRAIRLLRRTRLPVLPLPSGLTIQAVHADDVADAVARILSRRATGPFNLAADPLTGPQLAELAGARFVPVPGRLMRAMLSGAYRARLVPTDPGWLDLALAAPVMETGRARRELDWYPRHSTGQALGAVVRGMAEGAGTASPVLSPQG